jgi:hypothetical protein
MHGKFYSLSLALSFAAISGCAENHVSVQIRGLQAPQVNAMNASICSITADPMGAKVLSPVLDVALAYQYTAFPLIQNNLATGRNLDINRADTRAIQGRYADIQLTNASGQGLTLVGAPSSYRIPISSDRIDAANGPIAGYGIVQMPVVGPAQVAALKARLGCDDVANLCTRRSETVVVTIRPTFETTGGQVLSGSDPPWINVAPYSFPLTVCCGCLVSFPPNVDANCDPLMGAMASTTNMDYCLLGQDFASSCTRCRGNPACGRLACP